MGEDHGLDRFGCVGLQGCAECLRVQRLPPFSLDDLHIEAIGARHFHPALTELAVVAAENPVAAAQGVDDSRFHGSGATARDHQNVAAGLVQPLQLFCRAAHDGLKLTAAVPDGMTSHRLEHRFGHRGRARDHQGELVLHGAGDANR